MKLYTCHTVISAFQVLFRPLHTLILQLKIGETRLSCKLLSRPILLSSSLYRKPKKSTDSHEAGIPWSRFSTPFKTTLLLTKRGISSFKKNYLSSSSFGLDWILDDVFGGYCTSTTFYTEDRLTHHINLRPPFGSFAHESVTRYGRSTSCGSPR